MATGKFISYLRVSTERQGKSGLGLEAQRQAIEIYLNGGNWQLLKEYVEVESGKKNDRPQLKAALDACQSTGATLLIAKLDRLARNVAFISNLMECDVEFVACDFPQANRLTMHILAAVAEHEREMISKRTKEALSAAKARGVQLGSPDNLNEQAAKKGRREGLKARLSMANDFAQKRYPYIRQLVDEGLTLRGVARQLNREGVLTARGLTGSWTPSAVGNIVRRAEAMPHRGQE